MAGLDRPHPPGRYPVVVVGSGPGGLQTGYFLKRLGIEHALISADDRPGGMFQHFPLFQRLISWTKPHAPAARQSREYEWYDWNSLLGDEPGHRSLVADFLDGTSYFPARSEMEQGISAFVEKSELSVRYGCRWEATTKTEDGFVISTNDGDYRCKIAIFAVGTTKPWKPAIAGIEHATHYVDVSPAKSYENKSVFIVGKRNSALEIADALLPVAKQIILASPRPAKISVVERSLMGARARYLQPYEDHVLGGGHLLVDATVDRIEKSGGEFRVYGSSTQNSAGMVFVVDEVIAATGFTTPLLDLPELGVATFNQGRLPAQTPFWESSSLPGIYFAGSTTQGSIGLRKYGVASNSAAVHGFRYNARLLATHVAEKHFGITAGGDNLDTTQIVPFLLREASHAPELWNQQGYLARVVSLGDSNRVGQILPLAHFVDEAGEDAAGLSVETDKSGDIHPVVYLRRSNRIEEHRLLSNPLREFETMEHQGQLESLLKPYL